MENEKKNIKKISVIDKIKQMDAKIKTLQAELDDIKHKEQQKPQHSAKDEQNPLEWQNALQDIKDLQLKVNENAVEDKLSMVVFSGDFDKMVAAFIIATGAAAMGMEVVMFFTFWGLSALKKKAKTKGKTFLQKMFGFMLPRGTKQLNTSQFNFAGMGPKIFRHVMNKNGVASLEELVEMAIDLEVRIKTCEMSKELLGIQNQEMIGDFETVGVASFLNDADKSRIVLFI